MLTADEEDRLEDALPLTGISISYGGDTYSYDLTPYWGGTDVASSDADEAPEYPAIVLEIEDGGSTVDEPIDDVSEVDERPNEPEVDEIKRTRKSSSGTIQIAVERSHDSNGIPPTTRAKELTRRLFRFIENEINLGSVGDLGERPMLVDVTDTATPARVERTYRYEFPIELRYIDEYVETVDAVADVDYTVDTT